MSSNDAVEKTYVEMVKEKYENIEVAVCKGRRPTRGERELISLIFNKMVDPYYYWAEAKAKMESEKDNREDASKSTSNDILDIAKKYEFDISELNNNPSKLKLKKFVDVGFRELSLQMTRFGYSYDRENRAFIKKG